jgi:hypothetical protein
MVFCHQNNTGRTEGKPIAGRSCDNNTTDNNMAIKHDRLICEVLDNLAFRLDLSRCDIFDTSPRCDNLEPSGIAGADSAPRGNCNVYYDHGNFSFFPFDACPYLSLFEIVLLCARVSIDLTARPFALALRAIALW